MIIFDSLIFIIALSSSMQYSNTTSFVHICTRYYSSGTTTSSFIHFAHLFVMFAKQEDSSTGSTGVFESTKSSDDDVAVRPSSVRPAVAHLRALGLGKNQILIFGLFWLEKSENQRKIRIKIN